MDDHTDWFIIHSPKKTNNNRSITNTVVCDHLSTILKTKNLYLTFDDTNGIGSIQYLMEQILKGTGWTLGVCDTFYERDGKTEKVRSLKSEGKAGAYKLITDACNLFKAYPVFHGETKTVDILSLNNKGKIFEMTMGKDIDSLSVQFNSEDIITRLYVEGQYDEYGYVGIDDVNPTGLSYLMNFDYYKSIGMFTEEHQKALDTYYEKMAETIAIIRDVATRAGSKENDLNNLWGQINYVLYPLEGGEVVKKIIGGTVTLEQMEIVKGNVLTVMMPDGTYREETADENGRIVFQDSDMYAIKFITRPSATIGAKEVAIEAKRKLIENLKNRINENTTDDRKADYNKQIEKYNEEISEIYNGNEETTGLYALMHQAIELCMELNTMYYDREGALTVQEEVEAEFLVAMGDMLKEGYWQNNNYAVGQEQFLYEDSVDMINRMSWPDVKYQVSRVSLAGKFKYKSTDVDINIKARVYDPDLGVNDVLFVSGYSYYLDSEKDDTVELSNEDITITGVTFDSILSRMTRLADLIDQKNALYARAEAITKDGSIYMERLEGSINVLKNQLSSTVSSWYTDENGNIIFENTTGKSAMMLTGDGFMIANGRLDDGTWNWRTFGTGEGFTADAIVTGYLSADRIEARAITVDKLSSGVGAEIDLSENNTIKIAVESAVSDVVSEAIDKKIIYRGPEAPENPNMNELWLDTSNESFDILKRWNGEAWIESTLSQEEIDNIYSTLSEYRSEIEILDRGITQRVTKDQLNAGLANKADADWVTEKLEAIISQTAEDITFQFNKTQEFVVDATGPFQEFVKEVRAYQRFSADGLELGELNNPFLARLAKDRLSFLQDGVEIAYISNNKLYITEAQVTEKLSVGKDAYGYFDWTMTSTGLGLKWRG